MTLSFGGVILPVRVEDDENDFNRHKLATRRNAAFHAKGFRQSEESQEEIFACFRSGGGEDSGAYTSAREPAASERAFMDGIAGHDFAVGWRTGCNDSF